MCLIDLNRKVMICYNRLIVQDKYHNLQHIQMYRFRLSNHVEPQQTIESNTPLVLFGWELAGKAEEAPPDVAL